MLQRGFTLLEMLVALAVFAVLGVMSSQMVNRVLEVHNVAIARGDRLGELQRAMQLLQRHALPLLLERT
ncbi:MAG: prepilin-type N-terminal cleavage/methylation domain-containing protein [Proteobacteria bacterium]|nr:prepilin-type N-terminal cleavage/methylation domain-containing protein [Pseudomonadota bacterium]